VIALLDNLLTGDLLADVAGRAVHGPFSMLHMAGPAHWREKHLLFLAEQSRPPFALVKWARGQWATGLADEQVARQHVRALPDPTLVASCPPSWGPLKVHPDALITVERYYASRSIYAQLHNSLAPWSLIEGHLSSVSAWLSRFGRATLQPPRPFDEAQLEEQIAAPLRAFAARFGEATAPSAMIDELIGVARSHLGMPVPFIAEHGDLWPSNVLVPRGPGGELYIVDWEHYRPVSLAGFDMLFFCMTYTREIPGRPLSWVGTEEALRRGFCRDTRLARRIRQFLDWNCAATGLPRTLVPVLLPVMIARLSLRHADAPLDTSEEPESYWPATFRVWAKLSTGSWLTSWAKQ
jgi:hypothetical protein